MMETEEGKAQARIAKWEALNSKTVDLLADSPYGYNGAEHMLPAIQRLVGDLRDARKIEKIKEERRRRRRVSEELIIRAWREYRKEKKKLRDQLRNEDEEAWDWFVLLLLAHQRELMQISAFHSDEFAQILEAQGEENAKWVLLLRADWQEWVVQWLGDEMSEDDPEPAPTAPAPKGGGGGSDDGDLNQKLSPPKPSVNDLDIDY